MLTPEQRREFEENGYVKLSGAFPREDADAMADFIWDRLAEMREVDRNDPATWNIEAPWAGLNDFKNDPVFEAIGSDTLFGAIDDLMGPDGWRPPKNWGGFLIKFPECAPDDWTIPAEGWHVDSHFTEDPSTLFNLRVFPFLNEVAPRGGGTLVVRGSHRLVTRYVNAMTPEERKGKFATLRERFNGSNPWLERLTHDKTPDPDRVAYFMERDHEIDGVPVRVDQWYGSPGDVILAHPWFLHAPSRNAGAQPRFVLAKYIFAQTEAVGNEAT